MADVDVVVVGAVEADAVDDVVAGVVDDAEPEAVDDAEPEAVDDAEPEAVDDAEAELEVEVDGGAIDVDGGAADAEDAEDEATGAGAGVNAACDAVRFAGAPEPPSTSAPMTIGMTATSTATIVAMRRREIGRRGGVGSLISDPVAEIVAPCSGAIAGDVKSPPDGPPWH